MKTPISLEEQARRRKAVSRADWSCEMEGLGKPSSRRVALDERWISGEISREEYEARAFAQVKEELANGGENGREV